MYTMKQTCQMVNMNYETLKFYCNQGLIPNVKRNKNNHRIFDDEDIDWIKGLICLKNCGMSIKEMQKYLKLCLNGNSTILERKLILNEKREELLEKINILNDAIEYIDQKQIYYDNILDNMTNY